ncbi:GNVR domain-containing protein [Rhizobium sp. SSA_523]|uniref:GNVR domain-containing protein n=2 Tax=Rhizobium sp. SSA_523 TaxID=2952477 RepID=UPI00265A2308|nr:GNVR domain-containing protein [Rhizobium sp. SSA_523]WKC20990.1 GNVR domain-containing protein [Rhizobium sp. SSA_523]
MAGTTDLDEGMQGSNRAEAVSQIDFAYVSVTLRHHIALIAALGVLFLVTSAGLSFLIRNYYVATTGILVDPEGSRIVQSEVETNRNSTEARALNQQFILTSVKVLSAVVTSQNLADDPEFGATKPYEADSQKRKQKALEALQLVTTATLNKSSFVVNLSVTTHDPEKSARIANTIAQTYIETRASMNNGFLRQATTDLSAQLASLEKAVEDGDRAVQAYKAEHNLVDIGGRPTVEQQITEANTEISRISASLADNRALISELALARSNPEYLRLTPDASLTPALIELRTRYLAALEQQTVMRSSFGERHPSFRGAEARTRTISSLLDKQLEDFATSLSRNGDKLKSQLEILRSNLTNYKNSLNQNDESMVRLRELERKLASDRLVYESFLLRTRQLTGQEQTVSENPQIISPAQAPLRKSGPPRALIVAGATLLGLLFGCGIALSTGGPEARREKRGLREAAAAQNHPDEGDRDNRQSRGRTPLFRRLSGLGAWMGRRQPPAKEPVLASAPVASLIQPPAQPAAEPLVQPGVQPIAQAPVQPLAQAPAPAAMPVSASTPYLDLARRWAREAKARKTHCIALYAAKPGFAETALLLANAVSQLGHQVLLVDGDADARLTELAAAQQHPGLLDAVSLNRIAGEFIAISETADGFCFMPAGQVQRPSATQPPARTRSLLDLVPRISTLTDWLSEGGHRFDLVIVYLGPHALSGALPAIEAAANTSLVMGNQRDVQTVADIMSRLKRRGMSPVEPLFISDGHQSIADAG